MLNLVDTIADTPNKATRKVFVKSADALTARQGNFEKEKRDVQNQIDTLLDNGMQTEE